MNKLLFILSQIIPWKKFTIETDCSAERVLQRLRSEMDNSLFGYSDFRGRAENNSFCVTKRMRFGRHNSLAPVAQGKVTENEQGSVVSVTLRMHSVASALVGMVLLLSLWTVLTSVPILITHLIHSTWDAEFFGTFIGSIFLFGGIEAFVQLGFRVPAKQMERELREMLS